MRIGENIRNLRTQKELLQRDLAKMLNTSNSTICDWEKGRCEPNVNDLVKMSEIFNCSVDYLIGNENEYGIIENSNVPTLTKTQTELLSVFNLLSEEDQHQVIGFAKALAY